MPNLNWQPMSHGEFREWATATLGERRQVYARDADAPIDARLVYLPEGEANAFRKRAKSGKLICPVPGCPSPRLSTRGPKSRRHHFVHVRTPDDPQHRRSYARVATLRLLSHWTVAQKPVVEATPNTEVAGVPVTVLASLYEGSQVALCYVDGRLGAEAWHERHVALEGLGIATAWLFALKKAFFSPPKPAEPLVEDRDRHDLILDRPIYKEMRRHGAWPLLINLERQELANVIKPEGSPAKRLGLAPPLLHDVQHFVNFPLSRCRICPDGIETPAITRYTLRLTRGD
jgi:hypothetical protein